MNINEVKKHNCEKDCWIIINNYVYDVTSFINDHPGGKQAIMTYAGRDGSEVFNKLHNEYVITKYGINKGKIKILGRLNNKIINFLIKIIYNLC